MEGPKFNRGVAGRLPCVKTVVEVLLEEAIAGESNKATAFVEGLLRCRFQVQAGKCLKELDA